MNMRIISYKIYFIFYFLISYILMSLNAGSLSVTLYYNISTSTEINIFNKIWQSYKVHFLLLKITFIKGFKSLHYCIPTP